MKVYYNEINPYAAQWLRNLIEAGYIPAGVVDERSIEDVNPIELRRFTQCHFFAGIGGWPLALRLAGWPDDRPVWTGSCPCQPFSSAGKGEGFADERHLWPAWFHLIEQRRPIEILGEQVASDDGLAWLDLVYSDLEGTGYTVASLDICAAGIGAPHIRQRLWFVAHAEGGGSGAGLCGNGKTGGGGAVLTDHGSARELGYSLSEGLEGYAGHGSRAQGRTEPIGPATETGCFSFVAESQLIGRRRRGNGNKTRLRGQIQAEGRGTTGNPGPINGLWRAADWLLCRDGKWRPIEPGTFPLAHGIPARMGRLRAYGNAINPYLAAEFIKAYIQVRG